MHVDEKIEHLAKVLQINNLHVEVEIEPEAGCQGCKLKGTCRGTEQDRTFIISTPFADQFHVGETVLVSVGRAMGFKAVWLSYILPFFVLLGVLLALVYSGVGEAVAGVSALGSVVVYYVVLSFFRKKIDKEISFTINKLHE